MKVLVFTTVFPNSVQPVHGLFVLERVRHAARHCEVRVVAPRAWIPWRQMAAVPRVEIRGGVVVEHPTFFYLPRFLKFLDGLFLFLSALACVARIRKEFDFDVIDAHFVFPEGFAAVLLGRWFRRPVMITLRGTMIPLSVYRLRRWAIRWTLRRAERLVAVAHILARRAVEFGVLPERIEVIENGVDVERFAPHDQAEARRKLGLRSSGKLLVSVGHLSRRKGFHRVLRVLPEMLREFPDLVFAIVGGPGAEAHNEPELRWLTEELRLSDHVILAGARPPEEVALWLNAADAFVLASDCEGCPNVVWEALACGLAVVATKVGEVEQMVPPFGGSLYDHADDAGALRECLLDALRRDWDRGQIRAYAERHTWDRVAARVLRQWRFVVGDVPIPARADVAGAVEPRNRG